MSTPQNTTVAATSKAVFLRCFLKPDWIEEIEKHLRPHGRRCSWVVTIHRMDPGSHPDSPYLTPNWTLGGMAASYFEAERAVSENVCKFQETLGEVQVHYAIKNGKEVSVDLQSDPTDFPSKTRPIKKARHEEAPATKTAEPSCFSFVGTVFQLDNRFSFRAELSIAGFEPTKEAAEEKVAKWIWKYLKPLLDDHCYPDWKQEVGEQKEDETLYEYLERFKDASLCFGYNPFVDHLFFFDQFNWGTQERKMAEADLDWFS